MELVSIRIEESPQAKAIAACRLRYLYTKPAITVIDWLAERRGLWRVARRLRPAFLEGTVR